MRFLFLTLLVSFPCFADDLVPLIPPPPGLEWLTPQIVQGLEQLPAIGPWVVLALQYVGFIAAAFTALTVFVAALLQASRFAAWSVGLQRVADEIDAFHRKLNPYLAYFSIFNVQQDAKRGGIVDNVGQTKLGESPMKKLAILLFAGASLLFAGCTSTGGVKPKCADEAKIVTPVAAFLASPAALDCSNEAAIITDLEGFLGSLKICEAPPADLPPKMAGPVGSLICPPLVAWGVSHFVANSETMKRWGCKGTAVQAAFMAACQFIPI